MREGEKERDITIEREEARVKKKGKVKNSRVRN